MLLSNIRNRDCFRCGGLDILREIVPKIEKWENNRTTLLDYASILRKVAIGPMSVSQKQIIRVAHCIKSCEMEEGSASDLQIQVAYGAMKLLPSQENPFLNSSK